MAPILAELLRAQPGIRATLVGVDRVVDLVEEGHDAAVRIGALPDSSLIARQIGQARRIVVASPAYLAKHGPPVTLSDLRTHALIAFGTLASRTWRFQAGDRPVSVDVAPRLTLNDATAAIALAEAGEGLTTVLSYQAAPGIAAGRLIVVLDGFAPPPQPVHILYPPSRLPTAKLRAFIDLAAPSLATRLAEVARLVGPGRREPAR